jgi:hypothetical protein
MMNLQRIFLSGCLAATLLLGGCADSKSNVEYERERVSTVPWNKPAQWEGGVPGMAAGGKY